MNIPEEYRERYDSLARSHPWMREMRDEWMQSDFVNCGNPYREGDAVLDATMITSMRDETNGIPSETNGIAYDSPLVEPSEGDAVAILREASGSDVSNLLLINTTKSYDVEEAYTKLADMVERDYVRREECEKLTDERDELKEEIAKYEHDCGLLFDEKHKLTDERDELQGRVDYLESRHCEWSDPNDLGDGCMLRHDELVYKLRAERDEWKAKAEGYAEALEKLGCSVLANGTVFPPPSYDGADSRERLEADIIDRSEQCRTILGNLRDGLNTVTVSVDVVRGWLDRQAAITEREWEVEQKYLNDGYKEQIDELTAERDDLQGRVDYLESRHCEWSDPNDLGDGCMLRHDELVDKLRAERDELKAEVDAYRCEYDDMEFIVPIEKAMEFTTDPPGYVKKALADMHERIITLTAECGEYREKLSRALDLAHEIGRLQP